MKPLVIAVSGRPGSGKTTLAHLIARAICCPVLSRDEMKEGYCVTHGLDHTQLPRNANAVLYDVFFELVSLMVSHNVTCVIEAAFQHKLWAPKLVPLSEVCELRIIRCIADPELARLRAMERGQNNPRRERFHRDFPTPATEQCLDRPPSPFDPVAIGVPTLDVHTTEGYNPQLDTIVAFALQHRVKGQE